MAAQHIGMGVRLGARYQHSGATTSPTVAMLTILFDCHLALGAAMHHNQTKAPLQPHKEQQVLNNKAERVAAVTQMWLYLKKHPGEPIGGV